MACALPAGAMIAATSSAGSRRMSPSRWRGPISGRNCERFWRITGEGAMSKTAASGHRFNPTILREYDIRGIVGETLHEADARAIGRAFGTIVAEKGGKSVAVGRDGRLSS